MMFKKLTPKEELKYRKWARDHHAPERPYAFALYHPVVRDEWEKVDVEKEGVK